MAVYPTNPPVFCGLGEGLSPHVKNPQLMISNVPILRNSVLALFYV